MASSSYQPLPDKPGDDALTQDGNIGECSKEVACRKRRFQTLVLISLVTAAFITLGIGLSFKYKGPLAKERHHDNHEECGESPQEARQLGCAFDAVLMGWVPWRCHDEELANEFLRREDWAFYRDTNRTSRVPLDEILAGEWEIVIVDDAFHTMHCIYTWRKAWRVGMNGGVLDGYIGDDHHTNHCEMMLLLGGRGEHAYMKYASCPWERHNSGRFGWYRMIHGKKTYRLEGAT